MPAATRSRSRIRTSLAGHGEQRRVGRQRRHGDNGRQDCPSGPVESPWLRSRRSWCFGSNRTAAAFLGLPVRPLPCRQAMPKVGGKIGPKGDRRSFRFFSSAASSTRYGVGVKHHLPHGDRSQFALAKPGQHQRLVDQGPFPPEPFQPSAGFFPQTPTASPCLLPRRTVIASNSGRRRATSNSGESSSSANARRFRRGSAFVGFRHRGKGICQQPTVLDAPVAERHAGFAIGVAGFGPHAFGLAWRRSHLSKASPFRSPSVRNPQSAATRSSRRQVSSIRCHGEAPSAFWCSRKAAKWSVTGAPCWSIAAFRGRQISAFHRAARRSNLVEQGTAADSSRQPVATSSPAPSRPDIRGVGPGGNHNAVGAVLPDGNGCRPSFLFRVEPLGQPLPLANNNFAPAGSGLVAVFLNTLPMIRLSFSPALSRSIRRRLVVFCFAKAIEAQCVVQHFQ